MIEAAVSGPKRPGEKFRIGWDFTPELEDTDSIATVAITAKDAESGADVTATVLEDPAESSPNIATVRIKAGTSGKTYAVRFEGTSTQGDVFQHDVGFDVRE